MPTKKQQRGVRHNRLDPEALTPPIPREMRKFLGSSIGDSRVGKPEELQATNSGVLGVGKPGKVGVLELTLGVNADSGRTGLRERFVKAPMSLSRPLYVDPADDRHAVLYLRMTGGGLAENDRIRQRVVLGEGAQASITTQAATNVHRMNAGLATQWTSFTLKPGAHLEYFPGHTTLFGGSRLAQLTEFEVPVGASFIAGEIILAGRLARAESHAFDALSLGTRVTRAGMPLLSDTLVTIGAGSGRSPLLWGEFPVWGTLLALGPTPRGNLMDLCRGVMEEFGGENAEAKPVAWGVSTMVGNTGAVVRLAGHSTFEVGRAMHNVHSAVRRELCGKPAFDLRRM